MSLDGALTGGFGSFALGPGEGRFILGDFEVTVKASASDTAGVVSVLEAVEPPGFGPPVRLAAGTYRTRPGFNPVTTFTIGRGCGLLRSEAPRWPDYPTPSDALLHRATGRDPRLPTSHIAPAARGTGKLRIRNGNSPGSTKV